MEVREHNDPETERGKQENAAGDDSLAGQYVNADPKGRECYLSPRMNSEDQSSATKVVRGKAAQDQEQGDGVVQHHLPEGVLCGLNEHLRQEGPQVLSQL